MRAKSYATLFAVLGLGVLLAGCGSGTGGSAVDDLWAQVQQTHTIKMAITSYPPQDFQNASTQKWTGFDVDILQGFAKSVGAKLQFTSLPLASAIQAVENHREDITIDLFWTKQRAQVVAYSRPMFDWVDVVGVNATHPAIKAATMADLSGKKIGVVLGSAEVQDAQNVPHANVVQFNTLDEELLALSSGQVDGVIVPDTDIGWSRHLNPSLDIKALGAIPASISPPLASLRGYFTLPKGQYSKRFLDHLNTYLKQIACNGQESKLLAKYGMGDPVYIQGVCQAANVYKGY